MANRKQRNSDVEPLVASLDDADMKKYLEATGDEEQDQDDEETLAIQSDARETVEPDAPAMRTRGAGNRRDADTREDSGIRLDSVEGAAASAPFSEPVRKRRAATGGRKAGRKGSTKTKTSGTKGRSKGQRKRSR